MSNPQIAQDGHTPDWLNFQLLNGFIPGPVCAIVIYVLASPHMPIVPALVLAAIPAFLYEVFWGVRHQSFDIVCTYTLLTVAVGLLVTLLGLDPRLFLLRYSLVTAAFGLLCLLSLWFSKPIGFYAGRYVYTQTPEQVAYFNAGWALPYFRFACRLISVVWGLVFVGEAFLEAFLAYHLSIAQFQLIGSLLFFVTTTALGVWSMLYPRHAWRRRRAIEASLRQTEQEQVASADKVRGEARVTL